MKITFVLCSSYFSLEARLVLIFELPVHGKPLMSTSAVASGPDTMHSSPCVWHFWRSSRQVSLSCSYFYVNVPASPKDPVGICSIMSPNMHG
jgi:hypothetical protein